MTMDLNQHYTLAADPATPPETLAHLAEDYPQLWPTLLANPTCYAELRGWIRDRQDEQPLTRPPAGTSAEVVAAPLPPPPARPSSSMAQIVAGWTVGILSISLVVSILMLVVFSAARNAVHESNVASAVSVSALNEIPSPTTPWQASLSEDVAPDIRSCLSHSMSTFGQDLAVVVGLYNASDPTCQAPTAERSATVSLLNTRSGAFMWSTRLVDEAAWTAGYQVENVSPLGSGEVVLRVAGTGVNPVSYLTLNNSSGALVDPIMSTRPAEEDRYTTARLTGIPDDSSHLIIVGTRADVPQSDVSYVSATNPMSPLWSAPLPDLSLPTPTVVGSRLVLSAPPSVGTAFDLNTGKPATWKPAFNGTITPLGDAFVSYLPHGDNASGGTLRAFLPTGAILWQRDTTEAPQFSRGGLIDDVPSSSRYLSVFITTNNGASLMRLDSETGTDAWPAPVEVGAGHVWSQSGGSGDNIFTVTPAGKDTYNELSTINITNGTVQYTEASSPAFQLLGVSPTVGYTSSVTNNQATLVAFDTATNATLWTLTTNAGEQVQLLGGQLVRYSPSTDTISQLSAHSE